MNSASYSSWRAAAPPEMFGEPDDIGEGAPAWPCCPKVEIVVEKAQEQVGYPKDAFGPGNPPADEYWTIDHERVYCKTCGAVHVDR